MPTEWYYTIIWGHRLKEKIRTILSSTHRNLKLSLRLPPLDVRVLCKKIYSLQSFKYLLGINLYLVLFNVNSIHSELHSNSYYWNLCTNTFISVILTTRLYILWIFQIPRLFLLPFFIVYSLEFLLTSALYYFFPYDYVRFVFLLRKLLWWIISYFRYFF